MKSDSVQNLGSAVIGFGVVLGIILGLITKFSFGGFGFGVMFACWIGGAVIGVLFLVLGSILAELENIHLALYLSDEEKAKLASRQSEDGWICPNCQTSNSKFSTACKKCGEKPSFSSFDPA